MKNSNIFAIIAALVAILGAFLYLSKKKGDTKIAWANLSGDEKPSGMRSETRGKRNNNPFNIRYNEGNSWLGQTGSDGAFCVFDTMSHGIRAGGVLLRNYLKSGRNTIAKIITRFAPSGDGNNTKKYIADVAKMSGINESDVLSSADLWRIAVPMMWIESRYNATSSDKESFNNA